MQRAIRSNGIPDHIRAKVWMKLIEEKIGDKYDAANLLKQADRTLKDEAKKRAAASSWASAAESASATSSGCETSSSELAADCERMVRILRDIEQDVERTVPGQWQLHDGVVKLRRILVAYAVHINRDIAYCQGFNFVVAFLLNIFDGNEQQTLRAFVCIVDHVFPQVYFDHYLTGARADQFLLADFVCEQLIKNPTTSERKAIEDVTSSLTLMWFITLFHGVVPETTRLIIMDNFMLDGVKALFKFTIAILQLSFELSAPSSNEIIATIRQVALNLTDTRQLLALAKRIKLPNRRYFAVKRSFYMLQSSFNSDLFYLQSLASESRRHFDPSRALSVQPALKTKVPAKSMLINSPLSQFAVSQQQHGQESHQSDTSVVVPSSIIAGANLQAPRTCCSADKTKICVQNLGHRGRSHLRLINAQVRTHERSLMSPLRNCLVIGLSNCGKHIIVARQSSRRNFKLFREQDLIFHVHELQAEIFDGFYLEQQRLAFVISHSGELIKITYKDNVNYQQQLMINNNHLNQQMMMHQQPILSPNAYSFVTETLVLRDTSLASSAASQFTTLTPKHNVDQAHSACCCSSLSDKTKLKLSSFDPITNFLWIYLECEHLHHTLQQQQPPSQMMQPGEQQQHLATNKAQDMPLSTSIDMRQPNDNDQTIEEAPDEPDDDAGSNGLKKNSKNPFNQQAAQQFGLQSSTQNAQHEAASFNNIDRQRLLETKRVAQARFGQNYVINGPGCNQKNSLRKILIIDTQSFDIFSSFTLHQNMGPILSMRTCLVAFCHFSNPMSSQFSSRIIKIEPTGHYEHLLSFSDVVDFMITIHEQPQPSDNQRANKTSNGINNNAQEAAGGTSSRVRRFLSRATSFGQRNNQSQEDDPPAISHVANQQQVEQVVDLHQQQLNIGSSLQRYCRSILGNDTTTNGSNGVDQTPAGVQASRLASVNNQQTYAGRHDSVMPDFVPMNMTFIFRNGKIALFEFTSPYAIRTRESQLGRRDYSKIIDIRKNGDDYIISILTYLDKLIKVVV